MSSIISALITYFTAQYTIDPPEFWDATNNPDNIRNQTFNFSILLNQADLFALGNERMEKYTLTIKIYASNISEAGTYCTQLETIIEAYEAATANIWFDFQKGGIDNAIYIGSMVEISYEYEVQKLIL